MNRVGLIAEACRSERRETAGNGEDGSANFFLVMAGG